MNLVLNCDDGSKQEMDNGHQIIIMAVVLHHLEHNNIAKDIRNGLKLVLSHVVTPTQEILDYHHANTLHKTPVSTR